MSLVLMEEKQATGEKYELAHKTLTKYLSNNINQEENYGKMRWKGGETRAKVEKEEEEEEYIWW